MFYARLHAAVVRQAALQFEHTFHTCHTIHTQLWTSWAPKSVEVFNRIPPIFINGDADAYYRSIATLQVRRLTAHSCFR